MIKLKNIISEQSQETEYEIISTQDYVTQSDLKRKYNNSQSMQAKYASFQDYINAGIAAGKIKVHTTFKGDDQQLSADQKGYLESEFFIDADEYTPSQQQDILAISILIDKKHAVH